MANIESMIRGALAQHDAADEHVRAKVYQSSRNALQRMIASNRSLTVETALAQQRALEDAILRIEAEATNQAKQAPTPAPQAQPAPQPALIPQPSPVVDPAVEPVSPLDVTAKPAPDVIVEPSFEGEPVADPQINDLDSRLPPEFSRRRRGQRKLFWFLAITAVLGVLAWIGYNLATGFIDGKFFAGGQNSGQATSLDPNARQLSDSDYILIFEPGDPSALVAVGRGSAEIVNQLNTDMLRIVSLRDNDNRGQAAKPILLKIKPGVLEQIIGKNVTVEIYAKSGGSGPVAFSVECMFGGLGDCARKRFRIGLQPEVSVFSVNVPSGIDSGTEAFFAINTDITSSAEITGEGDAVDIVYVRLRVRP